MEIVGIGLLVLQRVYKFLLLYRDTSYKGKKHDNGGNMKILDLLNSAPIVQQLMDRKMPAKLAYGLAKNFRMITQDLEDYDKARIKILQDNWVLNPETKKFDIPDEDQEKWRLLHSELLEGESAYQPFIVDLALTESIEMTPGEFSALWFIFDGDDPGPATVVPAGKKSRPRAEK